VRRDVVGEVLRLLLVVAVLGQHREAHAVADRQLGGHEGVLAVLLPPDPVVRLGEPLAAVLLRIGEPGEAGVGQLLLELLRRPQPLLRSRIGVSAEVDAGGVGLEELDAASAERLGLLGCQRLGIGVGHGHREVPSAGSRLETSVVS
jgi:hypothetical protein